MSLKQSALRITLEVEAEPHDLPAFLDSLKPDYPAVLIAQLSDCRFDDLLAEILEVLPVCVGSFHRGAKILDTDRPPTLVSIAGMLFK